MDLHKNELRAIERVMKHGQFINGPEVQEFEEKLAEYLGVKHVITCGNGTDALYLVYKALNFKFTYVMMPSFNFVSASEALLNLGGVPVWVDVDYDTYNVANITANAPLVAVGLFGLKPDYDTIKTPLLIEDNAQCLGAKYKGKHLTGLVGVTSFFPTKNLACLGDGGAVYTNDDALAETIRMLRNHGRKDGDKYTYHVVGVNSRLDTIQASILIERLKELDNKIEKQRVRAYSLCRRFGVKFNDEHTYNNFTIKIEDRDVKNHKSNLLSPKDVKYRVYYPVPLHHQHPYNNNYPYSLPVTERLCKEVITIID